MKDKLRELADRWKKEPHRGDYQRAVHACADDLIYHLDAEGDGGATWWTTKDGAEPITSEQKAYNISLGYPASYSASHYNVPLYTHLARSGVVSDEDAGEVLRRFEGTVNDGGVDYLCRRGRMRAALESFVRNRK